MTMKKKNSTSTTFFLTRHLNFFVVFVCRSSLFMKIQIVIHKQHQWKHLEIYLSHLQFIYTFVCNEAIGSIIDQILGRLSPITHHQLDAAQTHTHTHTHTSYIYI